MLTSRAKLEHDVSVDIPHPLRPSTGQKIISHDEVQKLWKGMGGALMAVQAPFRYLSKAAFRLLLHDLG
jgi:hypothetical protein